MKRIPMLRTFLPFLQPVLLKMPLLHLLLICLFPIPIHQLLPRYQCPNQKVLLRCIHVASSASSPAARKSRQTVLLPSATASPEPGHLAGRAALSPPSPSPFLLQIPPLLLQIPPLLPRSLVLTAVILSSLNFQIDHLILSISISLMNCILFKK